MINKKLSPIIGKFTGAWSSGTWVGLSDPTTSPKGPLEYDFQSPNPRGLKNYHLARVGLGIVVEMEKLGELITADKMAFGENLIQPNHVQVCKEIEEDDLEEFTFVTGHGPNKSCTRVYRGDSKRELVDRRNDRLSIFYIARPEYENFKPYPPPDFLNSCDLCKKRLHGEDIFMYRGEGFCSDECRDEKIMTDQGNEKL